MNELATKKAMLKEMIRRLHAGESVDKIKEEFKGPLSLINSTDIAKIEEELINEGMDKGEIQRLCDVHIAAFQEALDKEKTLAPAGHPVHILMTEHSLLLKFAEELRQAAKRLNEGQSQEALTRLNEMIGRFKDSVSHYVREENVIFPYLEKHGITQPPQIMWSEHDQIRAIEKNLYATVEARAAKPWATFSKDLEQGAQSLAEMLAGHFFKENNILFPTALRVMSAEEWFEARRQFDELGYTGFTPESARVTMPGMEASAVKVEAGTISCETGWFLKEQLEAILDHLPVDITFVDKEDKVQYFSNGPERIFPRTKAVIGRSVQNCHPSKSVHVVNKILDDFRAGIRNQAEFWINLGGKMIHIRYFAVRSKAGEYLGCLEVSQDITAIQKLSGQKRLLD